jgi:hypothetical protein
MANKSPGLFSFDGLDAYAVAAGKAVTAFKDAQGRIAYLSDDRSGFLSKGMAQLLVTHIKRAIRSSGGTIGKSYKGISTAYADSLAKQGKERSFFNQYGLLLKSIKVLNRRYASGRGAVAGIDPEMVVPKIGWGGWDSGGTIKVSTYAAAITFGSPANAYRGDIPARPVIPDAIESFINNLGPDIARHFWNTYTGDIEKKLTDTQRFGGSLGGMMEKGSGSSENTGSFLDPADLGGMSVGGTSEGAIESDSAYLADAKRALETAATKAGLSAAEIAKEIAKWANV